MVEWSNFEAWYAVDGRMGCQRETSRFVRENGRWLYVDGIMQPRTAPDRRIGRNDASVPVAVAKSTNDAVVNAYAAWFRGFVSLPGQY